MDPQARERIAAGLGAVVAVTALVGCAGPPSVAPASDRTSSRSATPDPSAVLSRISAALGCTPEAYVGAVHYRGRTEAAAVAAFLAASAREGRLLRAVPWPGAAAAGALPEGALAVYLLFHPDGTGHGTLLVQREGDRVTAQFSVGC
jgi:hypothetical protein